MTRRTITVSLSLLCVILFALTAALALAFFNVERSLFNAELYLRALESRNFHEKFPALAAETLTAFYKQPPLSETDRPTAGPPAYLQSLTKEDWEKVLRALLPPEILRTLAEEALTAVFDYLNGKTDSAALSMAKFKAHVSGPTGVQAVMNMLRAQPPCTLEQIAAMSAAGLTGETRLILCSPSDEALKLMQPIVQSALQRAAAGIPDSVTLIHPDDPNLEGALNALRALRALLRFSPLMPMGFLLLLTLLTVRDAKSWLRWWGIPFLISGLLGLALALAAGPLANWAFVHYAAPHMPPMLPESMRELARGLVSSVLAGASKPIAIQSAVLGLIGIAMLIAPRFRRQRAFGIAE